MGRREHTATVAPPFQMQLWCKSVAISRTGLGLRNPGQIQTLMCYRKFRFHAISADLQSVGQGGRPWRNGAKSCPDSQPNHISWWLPPLLPTLSEGTFLSFTFSVLKLLRRRLVWSILFLFWLLWGWFLASSLPFPSTQMHNQLPERRHITKSSKLSGCEVHFLFYFDSLKSSSFPSFFLISLMCPTCVLLFSRPPRPPFLLLSVCLVFLVNGCQVFPV